MHTPYVSLNNWSLLIEIRYKGRIMPGITAAVAALYNIYDAVDKNPNAGVVDAVMNYQSSNNAALVRTDGSLTKLLSKYIVEPVIIATNSTKDVDIIDRLLELNTDIFASYYMQAFEVLHNVYDMSGSSVVDVLGTDNSKLFTEAINAARKGIVKFSKESYDFSMRISGESADISLSNQKAAFDKAVKEAMEKEKASEKVADYKRALVFEEGKAKNGSDQPTSILLQRNLELTVTKNRVLNVKDGSGNETRKNDKISILIPITIKAHVIFVSVDNLITMLQPNHHDKTFWARLDEYRSGGITGMEFIFCTDLIKKYKEDKLDDKAKLLELLNSRKLSANSKAVYNNNHVVGFEKNYNMLVITTDDKVILNKHVNGDISEEKYKQMLLTQASALTCTIIDPDYERVKVLTRDIRGVSDISFKALSKRKDGGYDLNELIKSLMSNRPPVF